VNYELKEEYKENAKRTAKMAGVLRAEKRKLIAESYL
jgi:hypothetical protein